MQKQNKIIITMLLVGLCSLIMHGITMNILYNVYSEYKKVRLDPSGSHYYPDTMTQNRKKPRIILFGDSRITQWKEFPELEECSFINRGIPGETTAQALLRLQKDIIPFHPDLVLLQSGINDLNSIGLFPGEKDRIVRECKKNLKQILLALQQHSIHVVVLSIFPNEKISFIRKFLWHESTINARLEINEFLKNVHDTHIHFIDCDAILSNQENMLKNEYSRDYTHLNEKGYNALNLLVKPVIKQILITN